LNMKVFFPSIPFNYEHFVRFIYVNRHNATFPYIPLHNDATDLRIVNRASLATTF